MNTVPLNLLSLSACCVDFYPQLGKSYMGGNSLNVASMWKKLAPDAHVSVITSLGNDTNGKMIVDFFNSKGIDTSHVYSNDGITANNQLRVDEEGERFGIEGTWQGGLLETFLLSETDWKWVAKQDIVAVPANNINFRKMIEKKHAKQLLSVDYLDIENHLPMEETVEKTDIAFITARPHLLDQYKALAFRKNKLVVVTLGALGSYAFYGGETFHQPAITVPKVVDTTGCGDAYQAAFALTYLKTNTVQQAMYQGALAASQILQAWGGVGNIE